MAFPYDNFRPPLPNPPYASTPNAPRTQRPRFAYSGPQNYPRPGSSASKPNPDFSVSDIMRSRYVPAGGINDSMINNCDDSYMDTSLLDYNNSFPSEYSSSVSCQSQDSIYYTCNESLSHSPRKPFPSPPHVRSQHPYKTTFFEPDQSILPPVSVPPARFKSVSSVADPNKRRPFYKKKDAKSNSVFSKKNNDDITKHVWRCALCDIVFTSSIPYNMHKRGSKHAKKLKLQEATKTVQSQAQSIKQVEMVGTTFRCELCGILANSPYQLKMHLEGLKHKTKVLQQVKEAEKSNAEVSNAKQKTVKMKDTKVNGNEENDEGSKKTEASAVKPGGCPSKTDFSCDVCELFLNSDVQLQQHLLGKFHKAKVEGTTLPFHGKKKSAIRKAVDITFGKTNTAEGKESELVEGNQTERSSETNKNVQSEIVMDFQPETSKPLHSGTPNSQPETSKGSQPEIAKDVLPETSKES